MPLIAPATQAEWDAHYSGGYTRVNAGLWVGLRRDVPLLCQALGLQRGETLILFGAGFGFEAEVIIEQGLGPVICCDPNPHIQAEQYREAALQIHADCEAVGDWAISLDAMPWLDDDECVELSIDCRHVANNVAHWITCLGEEGENFPPPQGNWKTLTQWQALVAPDLVVQRGTDRVL